MTPIPARVMHLLYVMVICNIPGHQPGANSSEAPAQLEWWRFESETSKGLLPVPICYYVYFHLWIRINSSSSWQLKKKKQTTFQICNYTINTLNVKIEQHMAKEIIGINQLNGITQTDMIRQICREVCGDTGKGLHLMQIMKDKLLKRTDLAKSMCKEGRRGMRYSKHTS